MRYDSATPLLRPNMQQTLVNIDLLRPEPIFGPWPGEAVVGPAPPTRTLANGSQREANGSYKHQEPFHPSISRKPIVLHKFAQICRCVALLASLGY